MNGPSIQTERNLPKRTARRIASAAEQRGISLLITLIVVLALSIVAVGVTGSNQAQSLMAKSSQFRMESFNASYTEIDAQIDAINKRKISDGLPNWMSATLNAGLGTRMTNTATDSTERIDLLTAADDQFSNRKVAQEFRGQCVIFGQQIGAGNESYRCNELLVESDVTLKNTSIESKQSQVYEYLTKN